MLPRLPCNSLHPHSSRQLQICRSTTYTALELGRAQGFRFAHIVQTIKKFLTSLHAITGALTVQLTPSGCSSTASELQASSRAYEQLSEPSCFAAVLLAAADSDSNLAGLL